MNSNFNHLLTDFTNSSTMIELQPQWLDRALTISENLHNPSRQFNLYLQALALFSFESWIHAREPNLAINIATSSVFKPELANIIDVICNLQVGDFKVCLIPTLDYSDSEITIPRYVIDIPEFVAHFYVIVEIDEELELGFIRGFVDFERLVANQTNYPLDIDWNYALSSSLFESKTEKLLVNLQCLEPNSITLLNQDSSGSNNLIESQTTLLQILPEVQTQPLWKKLTWEQAVITVTNADLRNWLYQSLTNNNPNFNLHLGDLFKILSQQTINLREWIQNQIEELEQELTWQMLPAPAMLSNFRDINTDNPAASLNNILAQISEVTDINIPSNAGRAYQEFVGETPLRLYAVTWLVSETEKTWSLLLILGGTPNSIPPYGVKLRISDRHTILQEQELTSDLGVAYLCTKLQATAEEKLLVTITPPDGSTEISRLFEFSF
ncbi:MAG: DUF1822 family protein [Xenococcaceae cyanobacterium MO_207.B15]|nr:DUF1822 family protein [Xenococcaceae cyanobacterium MO_207.B15]